MSRDDMQWQWEERAEQLDRLSEWLVIGLLAFMPLAFGAVEAWSEEIVVGVAAILSICFVFRKLMSPGAGLTWSWAYLPIVAFILVVLVQLIPLPAGLLRTISPHTVSLKTELLGDLPNASEVLSDLTVSFYGYATHHDLRIVLAVSAVFVVILNTYRRPEQIKRLLGAIAVIGGLCALVALAQTLLGSTRIYGLVPLPEQGIARSGPFVNHSHYGQFMNLSIGAALGLVLVRLREAFARTDASPGTVADYLGSSGARVVWALVGMMLLGTCTIFLSMTRGGMISTLAAATFTAVALSFNRSLRDSGWLMAILALGAFACVLYLGFDAVADRLGTLSDLQHAQGNRWQILKDISVAWTKFPVLGTGLGTHEYVYPMFDRSTIPQLAAHAENEYAQCAEETGLLGLSSLLVFGGIVAMHYLRTIRRSAAPICAAAYGLGFGLVAILIHSLSDFGQHLPANAVLTAIFCALILRLSQYDCGAEVAPATGFSRRGVWIGALVVVGLVWGWMLLEADAARLAARHWSQVVALEADLAEANWQGSDEEFRYLLTRAEKAEQCEPDNIKYKHWLNTYRWRAISRDIDANVDEGALLAEIERITRRIADELNRARTLCPTFGATWVVLGQLERSILGLEEEGAYHICKGVELAPCDATARLVAGMLEAEQQNIEAALSHLRRAVQLDRQGVFEEVTVVLIQQLNRPDLAVQLAQGDITQLGRLAVLLEQMGSLPDVVVQVRQQEMELLEQRCQASDAPAYALVRLAGIYQALDRDRDAIECYQRALAQDYGQIDWRFRRAGLLVRIGLESEAIQELETCLSLQPEFEAARRLLNELYTRVRVGMNRP